MNNRYQGILNNAQFNEYLDAIATFEKDRILCRHDLSHFTDVARIAYILSLEEKLNLSKDLIYATALLHDIGRHVQYEDGTPHELSSVQLCMPILKDVGYHTEEIEQIKEAILNHRNDEVRERKDLSGVIYRGDKLSRMCFKCEGASICNWPASKKNDTLIY